MSSIYRYFPIFVNFTGSRPGIIVNNCVSCSNGFQYCSSFLDNQGTFVGHSIRARVKTLFNAGPVYFSSFIIPDRDKIMNKQETSWP